MKKYKFDYLENNVKLWLDDIYIQNTIKFLQLDNE